MTARPIGILGGTFDPIHFAHLRLAEELAERLGLERVLFVPAGHPWQRQSPGASPEQRLAMVELAIAGNPRFAADGRETRRSGPSYSVDTLAELRAGFPDRGLCLLLGADAFLNFATWHRWQEILDLAHIGVAHRPGHALEAAAMPPGLAAEFIRRRCDDPLALGAAPGGLISCVAMTPLDVSATRIRGLLGAGASARYLLPDTVLTYIEAQGLYRAP